MATELKPGETNIPESANVPDSATAAGSGPDSEPASESLEDEKVTIFTKCHLTVKDKRIVAECDSFEASEELAKLLMEDVFIRVKPKSKPIDVTLKEIAQEAAEQVTQG